jgi:hypothetical protein
MGAITDTNDTTADDNLEKQPPKSFFEHLSHDVRLLIYEEIGLPPFTNDAVGFILTCRQAKSEVEALARTNMRKYLDSTREHLRETLSSPTLTIGFSSETSVRNIEIRLPHDNFMNGIDAYNHRTKETFGFMYRNVNEALVTLRKALTPVIETFFSQVVVVLHSTSQEERGHVLKYLASTIEGLIFQLSVKNPDNKPCNSKRIAFAWESRDDPAPSPHRILLQGFQLPGTFFGKPYIFSQPKKLFAKELRMAPKYYCMNSGDVQGEVGVVSEGGWNRSKLRLVQSIRAPFMNEAKRYYGTFLCYSHGIGNDMALLG